jgi:ABC-type polysaccharide/polyol phosphate transport system ATPase subunit
LIPFSSAIPKGYDTFHTMPRDPLIGLVGKPSSGKSTTLNRCASPLHPSS